MSICPNKSDNTLTVRILGSAAAEEWNGWHNQSILISANNKKYLFDVGSPDINDYDNIDVTFITHYHIDHTKYLLNINSNKYIGPEMTKGMEIPDGKGGNTKDKDLEDIYKILNEHNINLETFESSDDPTLIFSDENIEVYTIPVYHAEHLEATGYVIKNKETDKYLWISGDFEYIESEKSKEFLRNIKPDVAFIEATYYKNCPSGHQDYDSALMLIDELGIENYQFIHLSYRWEGHLDEIRDNIASPGKEYYI